MATPNPVDPDDHGEEIGGQAATDHEQQVLAAFAADMEGTVAEALALQLVTPVVPDGGPVGRTVAPAVDRLSNARVTARIWGPAVLTTGGAAAAVTLLPLPGPLALYVLALAAFAWWHCAGRPGPIDSVRMLTATARDAGSAVRRRVEGLAERRDRHETRRTSTDAEKGGKKA